MLTPHPVNAITASESSEWHRLLARYTVWNTSDPCSRAMPDLTREEWHNLGVEDQYTVLLCYLQLLEHEERAIGTRNCIDLLDRIPGVLEWREWPVVQRAPVIDCLYSTVLLRALVSNDAPTATELMESESHGSLMFIMVRCVSVYSQYMADRQVPLTVLHHPSYRQFWLAAHGIDTAFYAQLSTSDDVKRLTTGDYFTRNKLQCPAHTGAIWSTINLFLRYTDRSFDSFIEKMCTLAKT